MSIKTKMLRALIITAFNLPVGALLAQVIPASRMVDWTQAGVPGGIPARSTIFVNVLTTTNTNYKCAGDGVTDDSGKISNAIDDCPSNQVIYMPTAIYNFQNGIFKASRNYFSIRGDGPTHTYIKDSSGSTIFGFGQVDGYGSGGQGNNELAGSNSFLLYGSYAPGVSNISTLVANNNGVVLHVGQLMQVSQDNDTYMTAFGQASGTFGTCTGTGGSNTMPADNSGNPGGYGNYFCIITSGTGAGQSNKVSSSTATNFTMATNWVTPPDITSTYSLFGFNTFSSLGGIGDHLQNQMVQITAINNGTNLTIWPPLGWNYQAALNPIIYIEDFQPYFGSSTVCRGIGLENFAITNAFHSTKQCIDFYTCYGCWMTNVAEYDEANYDGFMDSCLQMQVSHCYFGTNAVAPAYQNYLWETEFCSFCLFDNNTFNGFFEGLQIDSGGCGNVVAYNLFTGYHNSGANGDDTNRFAPGLSVSHGAYPALTLVEGNVGGGIQMDEYWGPSGRNTLVRNWFTGTDNGWGINYTEDLVALKIDNGSYSNNVVDNILGNPTSTFNGFLLQGGEPGTYQTILRSGYPGIDSQGYFHTNAGGFFGTNVLYNVNCLDTNVYATMLYVDNYDFFNNAITTPTNSVPSSYYLAGKPAWFGNLNWPPFDATNTTALSITNIPAGYRLVYGVDPSPAPMHPAGIYIGPGS